MRFVRHAVPILALLSLVSVPLAAQRATGTGVGGDVAESGADAWHDVVFEFRRFERSLRFGVTLEILVFKAGEIGKYTRFTIRRGKLPVRVDMCLDAAGVRPLACPSS